MNYSLGGTGSSNLGLQQPPSWVDLNENGTLDANELQSVGSAVNRPTAVALAAVSFSASQVKINNGIRIYMINTDGADSFDSSTYAQTGYFNNNLLTNFLVGGGNDEVGGSVRNDNLWGGTGNHSVYGRSRVAMPIQ